MQASQRIRTLNDSGSDGWDVFYRSRQMVRDGIAVTELTIGEHDVRTDPSIVEALRRSAEAGNTGYAPVSGMIELREEVAARVAARTGVATTMENVVITPGGQAGLFAAHSAVLDPGDVGCHLDPYYTTYPGTVRGVGGVSRAIVTSPDAAFQPSETQLRDGCAGARSLLVNSPNNPTGVVYTRETMDAIATVCCEQNLWLISDEVYDTQVWDGTHVSPRSLPGMAERTLVVGSMSKSHAMTGSRVGWVVGPEDIVDHMIQLSNSTTYGVPGYIQQAALFALQAGDALEEKVAAPFRRRRLLAREILAGQNVVGMLPSDGAMYLMLDIRQTGLSGEAFANRLLDERRIAVMPGESFGASAAGHIRVAMTVEDAAFSAALHGIVEFSGELS
jgi:arginine:pyruvate transaminase